MMYRNTNEVYGESGPWEANSKESLADGMADMFAVWAGEKVQRMESDDYDALLDMADELGNPDNLGDAVHAYLIAQMRAEFIAGLEEEV